LLRKKKRLRREQKFFFLGRPNKVREGKIILDSEAPAKREGKRNMFLRRKNALDKHVFHHTKKREKKRQKRAKKRDSQESGKRQKRRGEKANLGNKKTSRRKEKFSGGTGEKRAEGVNPRRRTLLD